MVFIKGPLKLFKNSNRSEEKVIQKKLLTFVKGHMSSLWRECTGNNVLSGTTFYLESRNAGDFLTLGGPTATINTITIDKCNNEEIKICQRFSTRARYVLRYPPIHDGDPTPHLEWGSSGVEGDVSILLGGNIEDGDLTRTIRKGFSSTIQLPTKTTILMPERTTTRR